ncbi:MAG: InlB B-repeat-containing protein [Lachnospiraceae bacterium]|nr:InlB B-repeat-containing protein [Lachnospiraceae bacterium]
MKRKNSLRLVSFIMSILMVITLLPVNALAAENDTEAEYVTEIEELSDDTEDSSIIEIPGDEENTSEDALTEENADDEEIQTEEDTEEVSEEVIDDEEIDETSEEEISEDITETEEVSEEISEEEPVFEEDDFSDEEIIDDGVIVAEEDVLGADGELIGEPADAGEEVELMFKGAYEGQDYKTVLEKIKTIREEAWNNNYLDPSDKDKKRKIQKCGLTKEEYLNVKWSYDLEEVASQRAAEGKVYKDHKRPNGTQWSFLASSEGIKSQAENLAWNSTGMMGAIDQFYKEKDIWASQGSGTTGHYTNMINPDLKFYGVASYKSSDGNFAYCIAMEAHKDTSSMDGKSTASIGYGKGGALKNKTVTVKFDDTFVKSVTIDSKSVNFVKIGTTPRLACEANVKYQDPLQKERSEDLTKYVRTGLKWSAVDEDNGFFTIKNEHKYDGIIEPLAVGKAKVRAKFGNLKSEKNLIVYSADTPSIKITTLPTKTTYVRGESLSVKGGKYKSYREGESPKTKEIDKDMVVGFDSKSNEEHQTLTLLQKHEFQYRDVAKPSDTASDEAWKEYKDSFYYYDEDATFDVLVLNPLIKAKYGMVLKNVDLPTSEYGTYSWSSDTNLNLSLNKVGAQDVKLDFKPSEEYKNIYSEKKGVLAKLEVCREISEVDSVSGENSGLKVEFLSDNFVYDGVAIEPKLAVSFPEAALTYGKDYTLEYEDNVNAGTAKVKIIGLYGKDKDSKSKSYYYGDGTGATYEFEINPAEITIKANDAEVTLEDAAKGNIPDAGYEVSPAIYSDIKLTKEPTMTPDIPDPVEIGEYDIIPSDAEVGENFTVNYENGTLRIVESRNSYDVTFDVQGIGEAPDKIFACLAGTNIEKPEDPEEAGYEFLGWYKEAKCKTEWKFDKDIVLSNITLYAKWAAIGNEEFSIRAIPDYEYTGSKISPAVEVYFKDKLLKKNTDYTVKFYNNTSANAGGKLAGEVFDASLPYVSVKGKGNYTQTANVNFNILKRSLGNGKVADGIKANYKTQMDKPSSAISPLSSVKASKTLKKGTDYTVKLSTIKVVDANGKFIPQGTEMKDAKVPKNYVGSFLLEIAGIGNYTGTITDTVKVTLKEYSIANATVTIGKKLQSVEYDGGKAIKLTPAYYKEKTDSYYLIKDGAVTDETVKADKCFTVKYENKYLVYGRDYYVVYTNNKAVGTATMEIIGRGDYSGSTTATFAITGKSIEGKNYKLEGVTSKTYTGKAITLSDMKLYYSKGTLNERELVAGVDYSVSYKNNINKGTATVTLAGKASAGYTGKIKKTFKINAAPITDVTFPAGLDALTLPYSKSGVKANDLIVLIYNGRILTNGKDYTISYSNNKAVAASNAVKAPKITIKGKGNFSGSKTFTFTIEPQSLKSRAITGSSAFVKLNAKKADTYAYKPAITVKDGSKKLTKGKDYTVEYFNNTQADIKKYCDMVDEMDEEIKDEAEPYRPYAVVTGTGKNYTESFEVTIPFTVELKFNTSNYACFVEEAVYSGEQLTPDYHLYFCEDKNVIKQVKKAKTLSEIQTLMSTTPSLTDITCYEDLAFTVSYGKNISSGKSKGSITITGLTPYALGKVTFKFNIEKKDIVY